MTPSKEDEMALKLLHTADWHLGLKFPAFDESDQLKLTRARMDVVDRILGEAESYGVDAVLCAGDLFDDPSPEPEWWQGLADLFAKRNWTERPVFLLPGNHDPITPKSVYHADHAFRKLLPKWVHIVDHKPFEFELNEDAVLYAAPCTSQAGDEDLALSLPERTPGDQRIRIGMVHGQTFDMEGYQTNFPIAEDAAIRRGLDYLALGDTHGYRDVTPNSSSPTIYPGAPEPTKFHEPDAGSIAIVCFRRSGRRALVARHKIGRLNWRVEECRSVAAVRRLRAEPDMATTVLRLKLDMAVTLKEYDEVETLLDEMKGTSAQHGSVGMMQIERSNFHHQAASLDEFPDDLPEILKQTIERLSNNQEDPETARQALYHLYKLVRT
ncbi:MAG: DNA repair exonuclease [Planctomycetota bacterium]|nr:DNA repair exonuclease [Planctomycetota bacterium]